MKKIIDAHLHAEICDLKAGISYLDTFKERGNEGVCFQTIVSMAKRTDYENIYALDLKDKYKDIDVYVFGSVHESGELGKIPYEKQLDALVEAGCEGMKFLHMKPTLRKETGKGLDHPSYDGLFKAMAEKKIPALIHSKDPAYFWHREKMLPMQIERGWCYDCEGYETYEDLHRATLKVAEKHPDLIVILAHFFFVSDDYDEAVRIMETYPNVYFDITPDTGLFTNMNNDIEKWREFFIKYQDRFIFGTDSGNNAEDKITDDLYEFLYVALESDSTPKDLFCYTPVTQRGLNLPEEVLDKIRNLNFKKLVGAPKKVNRKKLVEMAEYAKDKSKDGEQFKEFLKNEGI